MGEALYDNPHHIWFDLKPKDRPTSYAHGTDCYWYSLGHFIVHNLLAFPEHNGVLDSQNLFPAYIQKWQEHGRRFYCSDPIGQSLWFKASHQTGLFRGDNRRTLGKALRNTGSSVAFGRPVFLWLSALVYLSNMLPAKPRLIYRASLESRRPCSPTASCLLFSDLKCRLLAWRLAHLRACTRYYSARVCFAWSGPISLCAFH
jgi:hypothetical protein